MGRWIRSAVNRVRRRLMYLLLWRTVFGERDPATGAWRSFARIASSTCIEHEAGLKLSDHVFVGHFNLLDASGGLTLEEGVQITNFVSVLTHSTHRSIRLCGQRGSAWVESRPGDIRAPVCIGAYSFVGPHSVIEAGSVLGRGTLVGSHSRVRGRFPDFAVLSGVPAQQVGDTRDRDAPWLLRHPELKESWEAWAGFQWQDDLS